MGLICIYTNPKSGSSMVTGIFKAHGVWAGTDEISKQGYPHYEWWDMKRAIKPADDNTLMTGDLLRVSKQRQRHVDAVLMQVNEKHYIHKWVPDCHSYMEPHKPKVIKIRRKLSSIQRSQGADNEYIKVAERRFALMETIPGMWIDTDKLMAGNIAELESAFTYCGILFYPSIVERCIDRSLWHHD